MMPDEEADPENNISFYFMNPTCDGLTLAGQLFDSQESSIWESHLPNECLWTALEDK